MSTHGFPDLESPPPPHGTILEQVNGLVVPVSPGTIDVGQVEVSGYRSITLLANVAGNPIDYTIVWRMFPPANGLTFTTTGTLDVGMNAPLLRCLAHQVAHIYLSGSGGGATADVAVVGSNLDPLASVAAGAGLPWAVLYKSTAPQVPNLFNFGLIMPWDTFETSDPAVFALDATRKLVTIPAAESGLFAMTAQIGWTNSETSFRSQASMDMNIEPLVSFGSNGHAPAIAFTLGGHAYSASVHTQDVGSGTTFVNVFSYDRNETMEITQAHFVIVRLAKIDASVFGPWPAPN